MTEKTVAYYEELVRQEMADKSLNFGCKILVNWTVVTVIDNDWYKVSFIKWESIWYCNISDIEKILWHEVMIWDFLDWIRNWMDTARTEDWRHTRICKLWSRLRLPYSALPDFAKIELGKVVEEVLSSNK